MKEKINIAEILKDCPSGIKLYTTVWGDVEFIKLSDVGIITVLPISNLYNTSDTKLLYSDGKYAVDGECILFPSKENRDWSNFHKPFENGDKIHLWTIQDAKDGDVLAAHECLVLFKKIDGLNIKCYCTYHFIGHQSFYVDTLQNKDAFHPATKEQCNLLFQKIKETGYKWNAETKTLEKLIVPKFKKGDKVRVKNEVSEPRIIEDVCDTFYALVPVGKIAFTDQNNWELVPNKFDITTLKPFDKVLVRNTYNQLWITDLFSYISKSGRFVCVVHNTYQCIPYESNEHLLGTTNDCSDFYKTWK